LLQQPPLLVEVLAPLIFDSPEDGARTLDSRMDVRRYVRGKRGVVLPQAGLHRRRRATAGGLAANGSQSAAGGPAFD